MAAAVGIGADEAAEVLAGVARARGLASLDAQARGGGDGKGSSLIDLLPAPADDQLLQMDLADAVENLRDHGGDDLALLELSELEGAKQLDLALLLGVPRSSAGEQVRKARRRLAALAGPEALALVA